MLKTFYFLLLLIFFSAKSFSQEFSDPSRTEFKDDAGSQGSKSGFFQATSPVNYPAGATNWWHLLDVRHTNTTNNFAMQFAGSFFDQNLYFRKTNNNPSQAWSRVLLETNGLVGIGTSSPSYKLDIVGSGTSNVDMRINGRIQTGDATGNGGIWLNADQSAFVGNNSANNSANIGFWTNGAGWNAFQIKKSNGFVGIGTAAPEAKLTLSGTSLSGNGSQTNISAFIGNGLRINASSSINSQDGIMYQSGSNGGGAGIAFGRNAGWDTWMSFYTNSNLNGGTGNIIERLRIIDNGNVGIATTNPQALLEISHNGASSYGTILQLKTTAGSDGPRASFEAFNGGSPKRWNVGMRNNGTSFGIFEDGYSGSFGTERLTVLPGGNVGIGTTNPGTMKLAVEGTIGARKVMITQATTWPDYVFKQDYRLGSLTDLEMFIKKNSHLPDVPSAEEVEKDGLDIGSIQTVLLKKIEELTLYIIEQDKKIEKLKDFMGLKDTKN